MKRKDNNLINIIRSRIFGDVSINITNEASKEERIWYIKELRKDWVNFWIWPLALITVCMVIGKALYNCWIGIANPIMNSSRPIEYLFSNSSYWGKLMYYHLRILLNDLIYMTGLLIFTLAILKVISLFRYRIK